MFSITKETLRLYFIALYLCTEIQYLKEKHVLTSESRPDNVLLLIFIQYLGYKTQGELYFQKKKKKNLSIYHPKKKKTQTQKMVL